MNDSAKCYSYFSDFTFQKANHWGDTEKITNSMYIASFGKYNLFFSSFDLYTCKLDKVYLTKGDLESQR